MTKEDLILKIKTLARTVYAERSKAEISAVEYDELTKFPELKQAIIDLLTTEFDNFMSSIDWVSPRPTTFRINLKNDTNFYLIYSKNSWIAQIEGKKYYLLNLPEEERAAEAISRMLRYGPTGGEKSEGGETEEVDTTIDTEVETEAGGEEEITDET
jgi:hypothetical protein